MNIKQNIHQEAKSFQSMPRNMQNKINQSNGMCVSSTGRMGTAGNIYYDTLCRITSIPITLYHLPSLATAGGRGWVDIGREKRVRIRLTFPQRICHATA